MPHLTGLSLSVSRFSPALIMADALPAAMPTKSIFSLVSPRLSPKHLALETTSKLLQRAGIHRHGASKCGFLLGMKLTPYLRLSACILGYAVVPPVRSAHQ